MTAKSSPGSVGAIVARATLLCGVTGFVIGLIYGLTVYAPTAWAAALEVGIPFAALGFVVGFGIVGLQALRRR